MFIKKILTRNSLKFKDCYTLKSNTKKAKLKYAISLADRLINYPDKSSIKNRFISNMETFWLIRK